MIGDFVNRSGDHDDGWSSADTVGAISLGVVLLLLIGATAAYLRRGGLSSRRSANAAVDILDRRLASGEIDSGEYQRLRAALGGGQ